MPDIEGTTAVQSNGNFSDAEERILLRVVEKMSGRVDGYMTNLNDVLNKNMDMIDANLKQQTDTVDLRFETYLEQQKGRDRDIQEELAKASTKYDSEIEGLKKQVQGHGKMNDELEALKRQVSAKPPAPMFPGLDQIVRADKQQDFVKGHIDLIAEIQKRAKSTPHAQRLMYNAADGAARYLSTPGSTKKFHHLSNGEVVAGLTGALVVGIGVGIGGTLYMGRRERNAAGIDHKQYKQMLEDGRARMKAKEK